MFHIYANGKSIYNPLLDDLIVIEPKCSSEMGKAGSLEFRVPPTNKYYDSFTELKTIVTLFDENELLFRGRVFTKEKQFDNTLILYCEGDLSFLVDSVQKNEAYSGTAKNLFSKLIDNHNNMVDASKQFQVGQITIEDRDVVISGQSDVIQEYETGNFDYKQIAINATTGEWASTYDYIQNNLIQYCGGYLRTRYVNGVNYIDWLSDNFGATTQPIEFGVNLLDLNEHLSAENVYTVLIPLGNENLTLEPLTGSPELVDTELVEKYGRIVRTHVFDSVTEPQTLLENAVRFMETDMKLPVTVTVKAVDMHMLNGEIQPIRLGNLVRIKSQPHNVVRDLVCTGIEYDIERPDQTSYTFGNPEQSLTQRYKKNKTEQKAAAAAAAAGAAGGGGKASGQSEDEKLQKFYDAWIHVDDAHTHINMGTLYQEFQDKLEKLKVEAGIDLNAATGNINIQTLRTEFDEHANEVLSQISRISTNQTEDKAELDLMVSRVNKLSEDEAGHYASLVMSVTDLESLIKLKADKVTLTALDTSLTGLAADFDHLENVLRGQCGINLDGTQPNVNIYAVANTLDTYMKLGNQNRADIEVMADKLESQISLTTSVVDRVTGAESNIASIKLQSDKNSSEITLKADKVTIDGELNIINGNISTLQTKISKVEKLIADEIEAVKADVGWLKGKSISTDSIIANSGTYLNLYVGTGKQAVASETWVDNRYVSKTSLSSQISSLRTEVINWANDKLSGYVTNSAAETMLAKYVQTSNFTWKNLKNKPDKFTPAYHSHGTHNHYATVNGTKYTTNSVSIAS